MNCCATSSTLSLGSFLKKILNRVIHLAVVDTGAFHVADAKVKNIRSVGKIRADGSPLRGFAETRTGKG